MAGPDNSTGFIFAFADACIDRGYFPGFQTKHYVLLLVWDGKEKCIVLREMVSAVLPMPCRVWLCKGRLRRLLGDSLSLPAVPPDDVLPPYLC